MKKINNDIDKDGINEIIFLSKKLLRVFYIIAIVGIFLGILIVCKELKVFNFISSILKVLSPLFIGFIIAWLFYPLYRKLIDKNVNKVLSSIVIIAIIVLFMFMFVYVFIPVLYKQVNDFISYIPSVFSFITNFLNKTLDKIDIKGFDVVSFKNNITDILQKSIVSFSSNVPNGIISIVKSTFSAVGTILLSLIIALYLLIDFDKITMGMHKLLTRKNNDSFVNLFKNIGIKTRKVVNGTLLVALMVFVVDTIGFAITGLNSAVLFGLFCGITDLIPYIGPYIGGAAAVIVGFTQSPTIGIIVLIIVIIVQIVESYVLQPMVMSKVADLNPVIIIISLLIFAHFGGIVGMILATPCIAILKEIILFIKENFKRKMAK